MAFHLLFFYDMVSPVFKKGLCRDRGVNGYIALRCNPFQTVAYRRCNSLTLMVFMNIEPVQIPGFRYIAKSDDRFAVHGHEAVMRQQR